MRPPGISKLVSGVLASRARLLVEGYVWRTDLPAGNQLAEQPLYALDLYRLQQ
jgi:hypothetical protein